MLSPDSKRTQSAICVDGGQILVITYDQVRQLFFQNPKFGYYFMQLASARLFENMKRVQAEIETLRAARTGRGPAARAAAAALALSACHELSAIYSPPMRNGSCRTRLSCDCHM